MTSSSYYKQISLVSKYYQEFDDTEKNKFTCTPISKEYISLVEKYIEEQLLEEIPGFTMGAFSTTVHHHKDGVVGDILDMVLTFTDFLAFKEMFLDYRIGKRRPGTRLKIWFTGDFILQIILWASFPEQSSALGPTWKTLCSVILVLLLK